MTSEIKAAAMQIKGQTTLEEKLNLLATITKDLLNNHLDDEGMDDFNLDEIDGYITQGIQSWNDYHDEVTNGGETPEQTQCATLRGNLV